LNIPACVAGGDQGWDEALPSAMSNLMWQGSPYSGNKPLTPPDKMYGLESSPVGGMSLAEDEPALLAYDITEGMTFNMASQKILDGTRDCRKPAAAARQDIFEDCPPIPGKYPGMPGYKMKADGRLPIPVSWNASAMDYIMVVTILNHLYTRCTFNPGFYGDCKFHMQVEFMTLMPESVNIGYPCQRNHTSGATPCTLECQKMADDMDTHCGPERCLTAAGTPDGCRLKFKEGDRASCEKQAGCTYIKGFPKCGMSDEGKQERCGDDLVVIPGMENEPPEEMKVMMSSQSGCRAFRCDPVYIANAMCPGKRSVRYYLLFLIYTQLFVQLRSQSLHALYCAHLLVLMLTAVLNGAQNAEFLGPMALFLCMVKLKDVAACVQGKPECLIGAELTGLLLDTGILPPDALDCAEELGTSPEWGEKTIAELCQCTAEPCDESASSLFDIAKCPHFCAPGTGVVSQSQSHCRICPAGRYQTGKHYGDPECKFCQPGWYAPEGGSSICTQCPEGKASDGGTFCAVCPQPGRCNAGVCQRGTAGRGCASCKLAPVRYYEAGNKCLECFDSIWLVSSALGLACLGILALLWQVSKASAMLAPESHNVSTAKAAFGVANGVQSISRVANTAVFASIALPHLQFSMFAWLGPFRLPTLLQSLGNFLTSVFSFDFGQLSSPECQLSTNDPAQLFVSKFVLTHAVFWACCVVLTVPMIISRRTRLHAVNALTALFTIAMAMLVRSCVKALDCTEQVDLGGVKTLDAMPEIECWTDDDQFWTMAYIGMSLLVLYVALVPALLFYSLWRYRTGEHMDTADFLAAHGWLVLKYRPAHWWFEFPLMAFKVTWICTSELLGSEADAWWLIAFQGAATTILRPGPPGAFKQPWRFLQ
jgi:hypothetical protein